MTDKMRWRYWETYAVRVPVDPETEICIGDLVWLNEGRAEPMSNAPDPIIAIDQFLGVALQRSLVGSSEPIRVATSGAFEFDCEEQVFNVGTVVGPAYTDSAMENQKVQPAIRGIGKIVKHEQYPERNTLVAIKSAIMG